MGSSNSTSDASVEMCNFPLVLTIIQAWLVLYLLLLPLFCFVLYVGYKQWKKQPSPPSHSDIFTFNIVGTELVSTLGTILYSVSFQVRAVDVERVGSDLYSIGTAGQMFVHALTCVERYLAVVHPITYLRLKKRGGVRIRNVSIAGVWLLSAGFISLQRIDTDTNYAVECMLSLTCVIVALVFFCSVSVLCVLMRPGPGDGGKDLRRVDQSKRRAFFTIMVIMGVLLFRFVYYFVSYLMNLLQILDLEVTCVLSASASWFNVPSSLVLPLLFLQRAGKLPKCSGRN